MASSALQQAILQSLFKVNPQLREMPDQKSAQWLAAQQALSQGAAEAGLPSFTGTEQDSPARLRLMDAIARTEASGIKVPHFIGTATEPLGDRGVTMDVENLAKALKVQEQQAIKAGDAAGAIRIGLERAFWEKEAAEGMSAAEWLKQTGESDPVYPKITR